MKSRAIRGCSRWGIALTLLLLVSCGGGGNSIAPTGVEAANASLAIPPNNFTAALVGSQETPPNASAAVAVGALVIDPATLLMRATINTGGIAGTMAHIHFGAPGVAGPIIFPLTETVTGSGIWSTQAIITVDQLNNFNAGNYYFNVHSAAFPLGEIRGQILPQLQTSVATSPGTVTTGATTSATSRFTIYTNVLTGGEVSPLQSGSLANALAATLIDTVAKTVSTSVITTGLIGTAVHIHEGGTGTVGNIAFTLAQNQANNGIWTLAFPLTDLQLNVFSSGNYYFDVHTATFPNGEIRAQILPNSAVPATTGTGTGTTTTGTGTTGTGTTGTGTTGTGTTGTGTTGTGTGTTGTTTGTTGTGTTTTAIVPAAVGLAMAGTGVNVTSATGTSLY